MTAYISPENEYPRYIGDIQLEVPSYQEGDALPEGWKLVEPTDRPESTEPDTITYEIFPVEVDGVFKQAWGNRPMTIEEIERRNAPASLVSKLIALGLTEAEIQALRRRTF